MQMLRTWFEENDPEGVAFEYEVFDRKDTTGCLKAPCHPGAALAPSLIEYYR
jgi:hypothetical protein